MKHLLLSLLILLSSCSYSSYQLKTNCKVSNQVLFERLTGTLVNEGLQIKTVTGNYLLAESLPAKQWNGATTQVYWAFTASKDTITGTAKSISIYQNAFGAVLSTSETYFNDDAHRDWTWYWNVRNELENTCGDKVIIFEVLK